jgi:SAM-dependent methyltransferase
MNTTHDYLEFEAEYYLGRKGTRPRPRNLEEFRQTISRDDLALIPTGCYVLDAGAGNGFFSSLIREQNNEVICLDAVPELAGLCRNQGLSTVLADLNGVIPFPDRAFDVVFSRTVVEHLFNPWRFFAESLRVLRPGGQLIVTTSNQTYFRARWQTLIDRLPLSDDLKSFTPWNTRQELRAAGFARVEIRPFLGRHPLARLARRLWMGFSPGIIAIAHKEQSQ